MKIKTFALAAMAAMSCSFAHASSDDRTPDQGAPFCESKDDLVEYMRALMKVDMVWAQSINGCMVLKGGLHVGIIQTFPGTDLGHVEQVRVIGPDGNSAVGYMLRLNFDYKP